MSEAGPYKSPPLEGWESPTSAAILTIILVPSAPIRAGNGYAEHHEGYDHAGYDHAGYDHGSYDHGDTGPEGGSS